MALLTRAKPLRSPFLALEKNEPMQRAALPRTQNESSSLPSAPHRSSPHRSPPHRSSPLPGLNQDVRYAGRTFHLQTEALSKQQKFVTSIFVNGRLLETITTSYAENAPPSALRNQMRAQHKRARKRLLEGALDHKFSVGQRRRLSSPPLPRPRPSAASSPASFVRRLAKSALSPQKDEALLPEPHSIAGYLGAALIALPDTIFAAPDLVANTALFPLVMDLVESFERRRHLFTLMGRKDDIEHDTIESESVLGLVRSLPGRPRVLLCLLLDPARTTRNDARTALALACLDAGELLAKSPQTFAGRKRRSLRARLRPDERPPSKRKLC